MIQKLLRKNPEAILFDNRLDSAIIGLGYSASGPLRAIYSKKAILAALLATGIAAEDLQEYYHWHIQGLNGGENSPIVFDDEVPEDV